MEFLKKHYEKILLSVVMLGLGIAAAYLPIMVKEAEQQAKAADEAPAPSNTARKAKKGNETAYALDFSKEKNALEALSHPPVLEFSGEHRLVNPMTWKAKGDGSLMKVLVEGAEALTIKTNYPLYTTISFDRSAGSGGGYFISTQQKSGRKISEFIKVNEKNKTGLYTLKSVEGPEDDPTSLTIELVATGQKVKITKTEPYKIVDGYLVDLRYEPEQKNFLKQTINDTLTFSGGTYKIVYITNNEVRVQSNQTSKQTTITWNGTP